MSTELHCPICQKRYLAGPNMVGKRVKCRSCGNVFTVPATAAAAPVIEARTPAAPARATATAAGAPLMPPSLLDPPDLSAPVGAADEFEQAVQGAPGGTFRHNEVLKFPWAATLDRYLPPTMMGLGTAWAAFETFRDPLARPAWAAVLRMFVLVGLYAGIVVPLIVRTLQYAFASLKLELPPNPYWRVAGIFALPATLGYVLWVVSGSTGGFIAGSMAGLLLTSAAFWVLMRLEPTEIPSAYAAGSGGFLGSVIVAAVILGLLNFTFNTVMRATHSAGLLANSPMGPSFSWYIPPDQMPPQPPGTDNALALQPPATQPTTDPSTPTVLPQTPGQVTLTPPVDPPKIDGIVPATQPGTVVVTLPTSRPGGTMEARAANDPRAITTGSPSDVGPLFDVNGNGNTPAVDAAPKTPPADPFLGPLAEKHLAFVKDVRPAADLGTFDDVIMPLVPSPWFAILRHKEDGDFIEAWDSRTLTRGPSASFPREFNHESGARGYALSPDGELIVRPVRFPKPSFQVYSLKEGRVVRRIESGDDLGTPELVGFASPTRLLSLGHRTSGDNLEVRDAKDGTRLRAVPLPIFLHSNGNGQLSPDGKFFALATRVGKLAELQVYDLTKSVATPLHLTIAALDPRWEVDPAGIAFAPDGSKVAVLFDQSGEGYAVSWNTKDGQPLGEQVCPGSPRLMRNVGEGGHVFSFAGPNLWLIGGDALVAANTGRLRAKLGGDSVTDQWFSAPDTLNLVYSVESAKRLVTLHLDLPALNDARTAATAAK